jgi:Cytochrome c oxidase subunit IV
VKVEMYLFIGVAAFFAVLAALYSWLSADPAGSPVLVIAFLMASLIAFFFATQYRRRGTRPEDTRVGDVAERVGPVDFFPPRSAWPLLAAAGFTAAALGVIFGLWLFLIGLGVLAWGVGGFIFQYVQRGT